MTPWTATRQAPLSMGFSRQEYWSGLPCPPPGTFLTVFNTMIDVILNAIKQKKKKKKERNLIQVGKKKYKVDAAEIEKKV